MELSLEVEPLLLAVFGQSSLFTIIGIIHGVKV
jgi:hypothetical protein